MVPRFARPSAQVTVDDVLSAADPASRSTAAMAGDMNQKRFRIQSSKLPHPRNNLRQIQT